MPFLQFADGLGILVQAWGQLQVLLNHGDLNLQVVKRLFFLVKSDARYNSQLIADMVGISKASALRFWRNILKLKKES